MISILHTIEDGPLGSGLRLHDRNTNGGACYHAIAGMNTFVDERKSQCERNVSK